MTGSPEDIRKVANAYKASYARVDDPRTGEYSIDHSGVIYLMGRDGKYLGFMPPQTAPDRLIEISAQISRRWIAAAGRVHAKGRMPSHPPFQVSFVTS